MNKSSGLPERSLPPHIIDSVMIANWLMQNEKNPHYSREVVELEHAIELVQAIAYKMTSAAYVSISQVLENMLSLAEFRELKAMEFDEYTAENIQRKVFLEAILSKDLDRTNAKRYAELRFKEYTRTLNDVEKVELQATEDALESIRNQMLDDVRNMSARMIGMTSEAATRTMEGKILSDEAINKAKKGNDEVS